MRIGTADLLDMLIHNEPDVDFTLALGADTFIDLASGKWRRTGDIFNLVGYRMIVFRRLSEESNNTNGDGDKKDKLLQESVAKYSAQSSTIRIFEIPSLSNVSSSAVRKTVDETILKEMLSSDVLEYIRQNQMYSFSE